MQNILDKVLEKIKPTKAEEQEVNSRISSVLAKINSGLKDAKVILGGSGEKGTWLRDANDADIFVKFSYQKYKDKSDALSNMLEKHLKRKFNKIIKLHGSRDYFQIGQNNFTLEIIPILDIKRAEDAKNITDVSPLHAKWVNKTGKNLKDDIRLAKQFCKANKVYGAESYIKGFSGYMCEVLTIHYGSFINLIKNAAKWKDKVVIDPENYWKNKNILMELNKSKTYSPLVLIDPVQADRNAAAALSEEKFRIFKEACKNFLKKPSEKFFEITQLSLEDIKKKAKNDELALLEVKPQKGKIDVVGSKLLKAFEFIKKALEKNEFKIIDCGWLWNKEALFYFIIKKEKLSGTIKHIGPPVKLEKHAEIFKKKYRNTFVEKGRVCAKIKRKYKKPSDLIIDVKKEEYLKDKAESIR